MEKPSYMIDGSPANGYVVSIYADQFYIGKPVIHVAETFGGAIAIIVSNNARAVVSSAKPKPRVKKDMPENKRKGTGKPRPKK